MGRSSPDGSRRLEPRIGLARDWSETVQILEAMRDRAVRGKAVLTRG